MKKEEFKKVLYGKEKWDNYKQFQDLATYCENSNELYEYFEEFEIALCSEKDYIKMRAFMLLCILSKWDKFNKINGIIDNMMNILYTIKPAFVRMCLSMIPQLIKNKPELFDKTKIKLNDIDYSKYKDTMVPLIKKDIDKIFIL